MEPMNQTKLDTATEKTQEVALHVEKLTAHLEDLYSWKNVFWRGIIGGIGTFIGATIIAGVAVTILSQVLNFAGLQALADLFHLK